MNTDAIYSNQLTEGTKMAMVDNRAIGNRISALRKQKKQTQEGMAKALNIGRSTLAKWETGDASIGVQEAVMLSKYFNISCDELLTGNRPEHVDIVNSLGLTSESIEKLQKIVRITHMKFTKEEINKILDDRAYEEAQNRWNRDLNLLSIEKNIYQKAYDELILNDVEKKCCAELLDATKEEINHISTSKEMLNETFFLRMEAYAYEITLAVLNYMLTREDLETALYCIFHYLLPHDEKNQEYSDASEERATYKGKFSVPNNITVEKSAINHLEHIMSNWKKEDPIIPPDGEEVEI